MPTEERGDIGMVKPAGWHTQRYDDLIDGKYLYNRCHLIGYQLAGENANVENLITGTRYLNVEGMLPLENQVVEYAQSTGHHVLYRVTPIYEGDNLLANGLLMEAYSVEDDGAGVCFCNYVYNVQPYIDIDYATGESSVSANAPSPTPGLTTDPTSESQLEHSNIEVDYIANTNTGKWGVFSLRKMLKKSQIIAFRDTDGYAKFVGTTENKTEWNWVKSTRRRPLFDVSSSSEFWTAGMNKYEREKARLEMIEIIEQKKQEILARKEAKG